MCLSNIAYSYQDCFFRMLVILVSIRYCTRENVWFSLFFSEMHARKFNFKSLKLAYFTLAALCPRDEVLTTCNNWVASFRKTSPLWVESNFPQKGRNKASWVCAKLLQSCPALSNSMDSSLPSSSVHDILQARILEWVAMPSSRASSQPRDQTPVYYLFCIGKPKASRSPW